MCSVAEDRRSDGTGEEADRVHAKRLERADVGVSAREEETGEDKTRHRAVQEEVVPLDGSADRRRHHCPPQLATMVVRAGRDRRCRRHDRGDSVRPSGGPLPGRGVCAC